MPTYNFRCESCGRFEGVFAMAEVPASTPCPHCAGLARRLVSNPALMSSGPAARLIESTQRSAYEPGMVQGAPPRDEAPPPRVTRNPLHAKLPRP